MVVWTNVEPLFDRVVAAAQWMSSSSPSDPALPHYSCLQRPKQALAEWDARGLKQQFSNNAKHENGCTSILFKAKTRFLHHTLHNFKSCPELNGRNTLNSRAPIYEPVLTLPEQNTSPHLQQKADFLVPQTLLSHRHHGQWGLVPKGEWATVGQPIGWHCNHTCQITPHTPPCSSCRATSTHFGPERCSRK